jgi:hypothetical protein
MDPLKPSDFALELRGRVDSAKRRLWVASPYIGSWEAVSRILGLHWKEVNVDARLLTDKNSGILAKDTLEKFAEQGPIRSLKGLHAKLYIVDDSVLVTSANLTECAFTRRYEAGLFLTGEQAKYLIDFYSSLWEQAKPVLVHEISFTKRPIWRLVDEAFRRGESLVKLWPLPAPPAPPGTHNGRVHPLNERMKTPSADEIVEVIARIPVPPGQITLYKALYESRDWVSKEDLADKIRHGNEKSLTCVFGPLSKRVDGTQFLGRRPGFKPGFKFLIEKKDDVGGKIAYRMRPELLKTMERHPRLEKLREAMKPEVERIFERFTEDPTTWLRLPKELPGTT